MDVRSLNLLEYYLYNYTIIAQICNKKRQVYHCVSYIYKMDDKMMTINAFLFLKYMIKLIF